MRRMATAFLVLAGLAVATSAFAVDLTHKSAPLPNMPQWQTLAAVLACDDGVAASAFYQGQNQRYGNVFNFGGGATLSALSFAHYGFGFAGPYNYDVELWDPNSCTLIGSLNGLVAGDAAGDIAVELVNLCPSQFYVSGDVLVSIDANSCIDPTDCYPDVLFDDQIFVACPWVADLDYGVCYPLDDQAGPFLLRVETDNCPVPTKTNSWGSVKQLYR